MQRDRRSDIGDRRHVQMILDALDPALLFADQDAVAPH
jgi:hypothetical protein